MGNLSVSGGNATRRGWRLKNPGRLCLLLVGLALVASSFSGLTIVTGQEEALAGGVAGVQSEGRSQVRRVVVEVTAHTGDTLWTLASKFYPKRDPRSGVAMLRRTNGLATGSIQAGQTLKVELPADAALSLGLVALQPSESIQPQESGR